MENKESLDVSVTIEYNGKKYKTTRTISQIVSHMDNEALKKQALLGVHYIFDEIVKKEKPRASA